MITKKQIEAVGQAFGLTPEQTHGTLKKVIRAGINRVADRMTPERLVRMPPGAWAKNRLPARDRIEPGQIWATHDGQHPGTLKIVERLYSIEGTASSWKCLRQLESLVPGQSVDGAFINYAEGFIRTKMLLVEATPAEAGQLLTSIGDDGYLEHARQVGKVLYRVFWFKYQPKGSDNWMLFRYGPEDEMPRHLGMVGNEAEAIEWLMAAQ